jgi:hypothetical protein
MRWAAYAGVRETLLRLTSVSITDLFQVSVALAGGVILKALHQRPNFYSAAVYLAQSSANLMVRHDTSTTSPNPSSDSHDLDSNEPRLPGRLHVPSRPSETPFWPTATGRDRATLRKGVVRRYRNMSGHDDLPRRDRRLVFGDVLQLACC